MLRCVLHFRGIVVRGKQVHLLQYCYWILYFRLVRLQLIHPCTSFHASCFWICWIIFGCFELFVFHLLQYLSSWSVKKTVPLNISNNSNINNTVIAQSHRESWPGSFNECRLNTRLKWNVHHFVEFWFQADLLSRVIHVACCSRSSADNFDQQMGVDT